MLNTLFYFILNMSIASCPVILALMLIRRALTLPGRIAYPLWSLAFIRMSLPFTPPTKWSLFNLAGALIRRLVTVESVIYGPSQAASGALVTDAAPAPDSMLFMNFIGAASEYAPVEYKTESLHTVFTASSVIWAVIAAAALITTFVFYSLTKNELGTAIRLKDGIYRSDMLLSPVLSGLFRPRIILPSGLDPDSGEGHMVIAHENVHKARLDNIWRMLAICATCLHWFNPFAWLMLKAFFADMELSCDEAVIKKCNGEERKAYAGALLRFAEEKKMLVASAFGRSGVRVRIINILNYKKLTVFGAAASAILILAITVILLTNPQLR